MDKKQINTFFTNNNDNFKDKNIGDYTYGNPSLFWWTEDCRIGKFCSIAGGVTIMGGGRTPFRLDNYISIFRNYKYF